jgi:hypothetical protein
MADSSSPKIAPEQVARKLDGGGNSLRLALHGGIFQQEIDLTVNAREVALNLFYRVSCDGHHQSAKARF